MQQNCSNVHESSRAWAARWAAGLAPAATRPDRNELFATHQPLLLPWTVSLIMGGHPDTYATLPHAARRCYPLYR